MRMRTDLLLLTALSVAAWAGGHGAAEAQTYGGNDPVCLQQYAPVQYIDCRYRSIPQCQASASGRAAMCLVNPFYVESQAPHPRRRR